MKFAKSLTHFQKLSPTLTCDFMQPTQLSNKSIQCKRYYSTTLSETKSLDQMPGPHPILPGVGTSWVYSIFGPYTRDNMSHLAREDMFRKYGALYKEHLGGATIVSIHKPEHIEEVMKMQGFIPIRIQTAANVHYRTQRPHLYKSVGLVDSVGEEWRDLRRKVVPAIFRSDAANTFISPISDVSNDFVQLLMRERDSGNVIHDVKKYLHRFGLEVMWMCVFGERLNCFSSEVSEEAETLSKYTENLFISLAKLNMSRQWWKKLPSPTYNMFQKSEETIFNTVSKRSKPKIEEFQASCPMTSKDFSLKDYKTIIERFIHDKTFDRRDVNSVTVDLIAAGVITIAYSMCLLLHRLGRELEAQVRLQRQLDKAFASDPRTIPKDIHIKAPLLKATVKEGFRCESIIPGVVRLLEKPITLDGYEIPPYTPIICQSRAAGLSEAFFTRPKEFIPERWLRNSGSNCEYEELAKEAKSLVYLVTPFGFGARMCIGEKLAQLEMWILLSKILHNFTVESEGEVPLKNYLVLAPASPVKLRLIERRWESA